MKNLFGFGGNSVIIINNKGINDLDFNYWMNNQLTDDNIEEILEGLIYMEQEIFKSNYKNSWR